ncbi:hypothetical protein P43SY_005307 [Pythium insidiosum]|uniref:Centromere protein S n=1 Tax=Pythium insidiosum TaxID=114742 RepID=A0AAD5LZJ7_PYTIN|nr:hypothetical protein P43SY_005307 [Pythium insidiosum]
MERSLDRHDDDELRQSLLYAVGSICEERTQQQLAEQSDGGRIQRARPVPSKETLALLAELARKEMEVMATELQHFAHHANRRVIKPEDVLLLARKDATLTRNLQRFQRENLSTGAAKKRRRAVLED